MADILIRGMEKPGSCCECDFCEVQDINFETLYFCNRNDRFLDDEEACNIPNDCPIIELPEHGDSIDRGAIKTIIENHFKNHKIDRYDRELLLHYLDDEMAPVVIPSNKEDDE